jgi:hypothetical protein
MKVGDLVRVRMAHRSPKNGLIIKVARDESNCVCVVQPNDGSRKIWVNPVDLRLLNASR